MAVQDANSSESRYEYTGRALAANAAVGGGAAALATAASLGAAALTPILLAAAVGAAGAWALTNRIPRIRGRGAAATGDGADAGKGDARD